MRNSPVRGWRAKSRRWGLSVVLSLSVGATSVVGPFSGSAHAMTRRCEVLYNYMSNQSPDGPNGWIWRAASVEYMNYC